MFSNSWLDADLALSDDGATISRKARSELHWRSFRCHLSENPLKGRSVVNFCFERKRSCAAVGVATFQLPLPRSGFFGENNVCSFTSAGVVKKGSDDWSTYGPRWKALDCITMEVDVDKGSVRFAVNGAILDCVLVEFANKPIYAAVCLEGLGDSVHVEYAPVPLFGHVIKIMQDVRSVNNILHSYTCIPKMCLPTVTASRLLLSLMQARNDSMESWEELNSCQDQVKSLSQSKSSGKAEELAFQKAISQRNTSRKRCHTTNKDFASTSLGNVEQDMSILHTHLKHVEDSVSVGVATVLHDADKIRDAFNGIDINEMVRDRAQMMSLAAAKLKELFEIASSLLSDVVEPAGTEGDVDLSCRLAFCAAILQHHTRVVKSGLNDANVIVHEKLSSLRVLVESLRSQLKECKDDLKLAQHRAACLEPWLDQMPSVQDITTAVVKRRRLESKFLRHKADIVDLETDVQECLPEAERKLAEAKEEHIKMLRELQNMEVERLSTTAKLIEVRETHFPELKVPTETAMLSCSCPIYSETRRLDMYEEVEPLDGRYHGKHSMFKAMFGGLPCVLKEFPLQDASNLHAFQREVKMQYRLRQAACVPIEAAFIDQHRGYIHMPLFNQDLAAWVEERTRLPQELLFIASEVVRVVDFLHKCSIVHGDLKLSNFLMAADGRPRLADFEYSRPLGERSTVSPGDMAAGGVCGTPEYLAPELRSGAQQPSKASDCYSLGVLLRKLVSSSDNAPSQVDLAGAVKIIKGLCLSHSEKRLTAAEAARQLCLQKSVARGLAVPPYWLTQDTDEVMCHLHESAYIKERIQTILEQSAHRGWKKCEPMRAARVLKVERVENMSLWKSFCRRNEEIAEDSSKMPSIQPELDANNFEMLCKATNTLYLLHGTLPEAARMITRHGFDPAVSNLRGYYGAGVYFCENSCKALQYTGDGRAARCMLLCRVTLGFPHYTDSVLQRSALDKALRRPPPRADGNGQPCDSIVVNPGPKDTESGSVHQQVHREFVIFDRRQAYPEFIVWFELPE